MGRYQNPGHPCGTLFPQASGFGMGRASSKSRVALTPEEADPLGRGRETAAREEAKRFMAEEMADRLMSATFGQTPPLRYGERVLNVAKVIEIRRLAGTGASRTALAGRYGVSRQAIHKIISGRTWAAA